ncbi:Uncharacterised protein [Helicobacter cholecystus]|nr:Uncharacterised protein [Helicobacter cholecystus]
MIAMSESIIAFSLLNLALGIFLYYIAVIYRLIIFKSLKLLGNCFAIFSLLLLNFILFFKPSTFIILLIAIISSISLIYDFLQNHKKCYLCSCSSLIIVHLYGIIIIGCLSHSVLAFFIYLYLTNFCLFFSCFSKLATFKQIFCLSFFVTLLIFCLSWLEAQSGQILFVCYLTVYSIISICIIVLITINIFSYLVQIIKKNS